MSEAERTDIEIGEGEEARSIAVLRRDGTAPDIVWLGGYRSDMAGTKAEALDRWGADAGQGVVRFDYSGHGVSGGDFLDGSISRWLAESSTVIETCTDALPVLVGSSMGGYLALLTALGRHAAGNPVAGLVLLAPAVDMTERLMWEEFPGNVRAEIMDKGVWVEPSQYDPAGNPITRKLIEDGRNYLIMDRATLQVGCPVHIVHGRDDPDVPLGLSLELVSRLAHDDVTLTVVHDGDHRLSREQDIALLVRVVADMVAGV
ncbi:alpha/beta hydrolase [Microbaculum marinisediminis]|uniref:Alpha/beta hydrolase n=1 Tax=Microbaculum marinisediminis TaxID=2931392 RepID=A0AAW5QWQ6_9HYPH|nr:alpha/beta hydrolase [Microbaculum sp. A6E488]MCT8970828.1 alpha/beta hydrolase [Microbaculum sp. A6E488]